MKAMQEKIKRRAHMIESPPFTFHRAVILLLALPYDSVILRLILVLPTLLPTVLPPQYVQHYHHQLPVDMPFQINLVEGTHVARNHAPRRVPFYG